MQTDSYLLWMREIVASYIRSKKCKEQNETENKLTAIDDKYPLANLFLWTEFS